jgi:hypothetical protein
MIKYLIEVEKGTGVILFLGSSIFALILLISPVKYFRNKFDIFFKNKTIIFLFCASLTGYFLYALAGYFGIFVFYGRILHQYFPFIIWGFIYFVDSLNISRIYKRAIFGLVIALSFYSFYNFFAEFNSVAYPRDIFYEYGITTESKEDDYLSIEKYDIKKLHLLAVADPDKSPLKYDAETPPYYYYSPPTKNPFRKYPAVNTNDLIFINFCGFWPIGKYPPKNSMLRTYYRKLRNKYIEEPELVSEIQPFKRFMPGSDWTIIFEKPHFITIGAYHFEGFAIETRRLLKERPYRVIIAKKNK